VDDILEQWLSRVDAYLLAWPYSRQVVVDYAETGGGVAQYRLRVTLLDGSLLQCVERAHVKSADFHIERYSFHWQRADGSFLRRWDNAPHHREISNFPHHVHIGDESHILPHEAVDVFKVLENIETILMGNIASPPE
jgi:hypothetical protein